MERLAKSKGNGKGQSSFSNVAMAYVYESMQDGATQSDVARLVKENYTEPTPLSKQKNGHSEDVGAGDAKERQKNSKGAG